VTPDTTGVPIVEITPVMPVAGLTPATVDFGTVTLGRSAGSQVVTLSNSGTAPLTISGTSVAGPQGPEFFTTSSTCVAPVAPGGSCQVGVAFTPKGPGPRSATLTMTSNLGPLTTALSGTGVSNEFTFTKLTRNKAKGTAKVFVAVPGAGALQLTGLGVHAQNRTVSGPTTAALKVVPKTKLRATLARTGEVRVKVKVTYTPTGGDPRSKTKWVKLVLA
jgi:hypothetical protein